MPVEIKNRYSGAVQFTHDGASLRDASLRDANLRDANLRDANLRGANLRGTDLWGADLWGADLRGADLRGADLWGTDLRGANLRDANLWGANLRGANLRDANLWGANLRGTDLRGTDLWGADLYDYKVVRHVGTAQRSDGHEFRAFIVEGPAELFVRAGCRAFTLANFKAHVAASYPNTPKAAETLAILDFLETQAACEPWA